MAEWEEYWSSEACTIQTRRFLYQTILVHWWKLSIKMNLLNLEIAVIGSLDPLEQVSVNSTAINNTAPERTHIRVISSKYRAEPEGCSINTLLHHRLPPASALFGSRRRAPHLSRCSLISGDTVKLRQMCYSTLEMRLRENSFMQNWASLFLGQGFSKKTQTSGKRFLT